LGGRNAEVAQHFDFLCELHYLAGKYPESEPFLKESLSMRVELSDPNHADTAESFNHSGILYNLTAEYAKLEFFLFNHLNIFFCLPPEQVFLFNHLNKFSCLPIEQVFSFNHLNKFFCLID